MTVLLAWCPLALAQNDEYFYYEVKLSKTTLQSIIMFVYRKLQPVCRKAFAELIAQRGREILYKGLQSAQPMLFVGGVVL